MVLTKKLRKAQKKAQDKSNPFDPETKVRYPFLEKIK